MIFFLKQIFDEYIFDYLPFWEKGSLLTKKRIVVNLGSDIQNLSRILVLSNRVLVFWVYQNQSHSDYMKVRFGTGLGSIGFSSGLVNLQRTGTTRCIFGSDSNWLFDLKVPDLYLFCNQNISKIDLKIKKRTSNVIIKNQMKCKHSYW